MLRLDKLFLLPLTMLWAIFAANVGQLTFQVPHPCFPCIMLYYLNDRLVCQNYALICQPVRCELFFNQILPCDIEFLEIQVAIKPYNLQSVQQEDGEWCATNSP